MHIRPTRSVAVFPELAPAMQAFHFDTVDSTNEAAKRLIAEDKIAETAYVLAREQKVGKGTRGRVWISPRDAGVYLTVIHRPIARAIPGTTAFALAAGVACAESLADVVGLAVHLKPINDLYVSGRKLGGILIETMVQAGAVTALLTGVGINVRRAPRVLPTSAAEATCLEDLLSPAQFCLWRSASLVEALVARIDRWHGAVMAGDITLVDEAWLRFALPGSAVPRCEAMPPPL